MNYQASSDLLSQIKNIERKAIFNIFFRLLVVFICYIIVYSGDPISIAIIVTVLAVAGLLGIVTYSQINSQKSILNATAIEVEIDNENVVVKTAPFKVLFINIQSKSLQFNKRSVKIRSVDFPLKKSFDLRDEVVIKLIEAERECYLLLDFFDKDLKEQLT